MRRLSALGNSSPMSTCGNSDLRFSFRFDPSDRKIQVSRVWKLPDVESVIFATTRSCSPCSIERNAFSNNCACEVPNGICLKATTIRSRFTWRIKSRTFGSGSRSRLRLDAESIFPECSVFGPKSETAAERIIASFQA